MLGGSGAPSDGRFVVFLAPEERCDQIPRFLALLIDSDRFFGPSDRLGWRGHCIGPRAGHTACVAAGLLDFLAPSLAFIADGAVISGRDQPSIVKLGQPLEEIVEVSQLIAFRV